MNEFLRELAERKHYYHNLLYVKQPQAYTNQDCFERIERKNRYDELLYIIDCLPIEQRQKFTKFYKELSES